MTTLTTLTTLEYYESTGVGYVTLSRPEVRNAFDETMIAELSSLLQELAARGDLRALVLSGRGKAFCAGADLNYMRRMREYDAGRNLEDSLAIAECFHLLARFPRPTLCKVHGAAIGGGVGFVAACDFVFAEEHTMFSLSEVKIGLVPACISPFVIKRMGETKARQYFISGARFAAPLAESLGLCDRSLPQGDLDPSMEQLLEMIKSSGPEAVTCAKRLVQDVVDLPRLDDAKHFTAEVIAAIRVGAEAQEGMTAFLEKRTPTWVQS
ncbi:MAG: hypothetical protein A2284_16490 [Deltaproteobacteria bacterium RIFOXYA12_FULL_61_11]|nr:MAG: hypothetical protein A2284_16490 [Deltaproteobacteria bacterium RIFOXYA12_FULL_61_11]